MYGLTGTLPTFGVKLDFLKRYCPVIYTKKIEEITGTLVKDYEIQVHLLKPSEKQDITLKSGKTWSEKAQIQFYTNKYQITRSFSMMLLLIKAVQNSKTKFDYLQKLVKETDKSLIFLETKEQCKQLKLPSYYSGLSTSEQNLEDFQQGKINHLASIGQLKAGVTFKNVDKAILLHCYSSSSKAHQRCARVLNYVEGGKATLYILGLKGTRDEDWIKKGLQGFDQNKIKYIDVK
jgi:superfamily II DNA or RNA helicase